jgi:hypothetical protein
MMKKLLLLTLINAMSLFAMRPSGKTMAANALDDKTLFFEDDSSVIEQKISFDEFTQQMSQKGVCLAAHDKKSVVTYDNTHILEGYVKDDRPLETCFYLRFAYAGRVTEQLYKLFAPEIELCVSQQLPWQNIKCEGLSYILYDKLTPDPLVAGELIRFKKDAVEVPLQAAVLHAISQITISETLWESWGFPARSPVHKMQTTLNAALVYVINAQKYHGSYAKDSKKSMDTASYAKAYKSCLVKLKFQADIARLWNN